MSKFSPFSVLLFASVAAAWKGLQERNVVLEDTEEGYAAQLGDSVRTETDPLLTVADANFDDVLRG